MVNNVKPMIVIVYVPLFVVKPAFNAMTKYIIWSMQSLEPAATFGSADFESLNTVVRL